jgi:uncharacterized protein
MKRIVTSFIRLLRDAGIPVTTQEAMDCIEACRLMGYDLALLRSVMEITLVKSQWEQAVFETAFDLFFMPQLQSPEAQAAVYVLPAGTADGSGQGNAGAGGPSQTLLSSIEGQPPPVIETLARQIVESIILEQGTPEEMMTRLRQLQVDAGWFGAVNHVERRYLKGEIDERVYRQWLDQFTLLERAIQRELSRKAVRGFGAEALRSLLAYANIRRREFYALSPVEMHAVEHEVAKLARRLAEQPGIRLRKANRGKIHISRTFRDIVGTGGCPIRLRYRDKTKSKVDLWLLCDVSNSVERFSRFMLQLVHAAQKRYANVRSFVFVDRPVDVTEWFRHQDVTAFFQARELRELFSRTGFSRYDLVFEQIARHHLPEINARTKILILGDARNNWLRGGREELAKIAERAQAIYWLNPLPQGTWQQGDCILEQYREYCRQVFECRNLEQLTNVAARIL